MSSRVEMLGSGVRRMNPQAVAHLRDPEAFGRTWMREAADENRGAAVFVMEKGAAEAVARAYNAYASWRGSLPTMLLSPLTEYDDDDLEGIASGDFGEDVKAIAVEMGNDASAFRAFAEKASVLGAPTYLVDGDTVWAAAPLAAPPARSPAAHLAFINAYRARIGQRPLDPRASGWTDEDVALEAEALRRAGNPRSALLSW